MISTFEQRRRRTGLFFVAPALIVLAAILFYPIVDSILLALQRVQLAGGAVTQEWAGFGNFERLFTDAVFWKAAGEAADPIAGPSRSSLEFAAPAALVFVLAALTVGGGWAYAQAQATAAQLYAPARYVSVVLDGSVRP